MFKDFSIITLKALSVFFRVLILFLISDVSSADDFLFYSQSLNFSNVAILVLGLDLIRHISKKITDLGAAFKMLWSFHSRSMLFILFGIIYALSLFIDKLILLITVFIVFEYVIQEICRILIIIGKRISEAIVQFTKNLFPLLACFILKEDVVETFFLSSMITAFLIILAVLFKERINLKILKPSKNPFNKTIFLFILSSMTITVIFRLFFFADKIFIENYEDNFIVDYILVVSLAMFTPFIPDNIHNNKVMPKIIKGQPYSLKKFISINYISALLIAIILTVFYTLDIFDIFKGSLAASYVFFLTFLVGIISTLISYMSIVIRYDIFKYSCISLLLSFFTFCILNLVFGVLIAWFISAIALHASLLFKFIYEKRLENS